MSTRDTDEDIDILLLKENQQISSAEAESTWRAKDAKTTTEESWNGRTATARMIQLLHFSLSSMVTQLRESLWTRYKFRSDYF